MSRPFTYYYTPLDYIQNAAGETEYTWNINEKIRKKQSHSKIMSSAIVLSHFYAYGPLLFYKGYSEQNASSFHVPMTLKT